MAPAAGPGWEEPTSQLYPPFPVELDYVFTLPSARRGRRMMAVLSCHLIRSFLLQSLRGHDGHHLSERVRSCSMNRVSECVCTSSYTPYVQKALLVHQTSHGVTLSLLPQRLKGFAVISRCYDPHYCGHTPNLRYQTAGSIGALARDEPVIPRVTFLSSPAPSSGDMEVR